MLQALHSFSRRYHQFLTQHRTLIWIALGIYVVGFVAYMLLDNASLTPDRIVLVLFIAAVALGQGVRFLRDWLPFMVLFLAYEGLRGLADFSGDVNIGNIISAERVLTGATIPTIWLQSQLFHGSPSWLDIASTTIYFLHFPLPLILAFWLWLKDKQWYWQFVTSLLVLCFASFVTYVIFPAAPPWLAAKDGYLPPVTKIIDHVLVLSPHSMSVSYLYHSLNSNQVAAMPSLHAAFPWLVFLMLWQVVGKKAAWFLPYCVAVWFSIIYLGEHYVVDVIAGMVYAQAAFFAGTVLYRSIVRRLASRKLIMTARAVPALALEQVVD